MLFHFYSMSSLQLIILHFNLHNTQCKIELLAEYQYFFSNCCLGYYVMEQFSTAKRIFIVKTIYKNGECVTQTVQNLQSIFDRNKALRKATVHRLMTKFETTDLILIAKIRWAETFSLNSETARFCARQCCYESRKINLLIITAVG